MISKGEFKFDNATYGVILSHTKASTEAVLVNAGTVVSAYKTDITGNYSYANVRAKELVSKLKTGLRQCTSKNGVPTPCELGSMNTHNFTKSKVQYSIMLYRGEVYGAYITSDTFEINLEYTTQFTIPKNIPYIKLTDIETENKEADNDLDSVPVRTVEEIALEKEDVSWLKNKKYYVVNDDETAEKLFTFFDNYNGIIAYDTETTGLKINCFGKINSKYQKDLIKYNEEHPNDKIRADKLVGLIFCVEPNVSYYFAAGHRKFKNLYDDRNSETRKKVVANIKAKYTVGELKDEQGDMARYIRETPDTEWSSDIILMERCRHILETKTLVAHNGTYEYKVGLQYDIDTNIKEDTIIMHQLMYKFRSTTSNRGEPSNLKYLAKVELGVDQWELKDFFPNLKEDKKGTVKGKGNKSRIDFSYMDYAGTQVYAPTDGDVTLQLYYKYKKDMLENHKEMEYIYSVEMIVSLAMGYMEFYGHRLDETKLDSTRARTEADIAVIESKIRQMINYSSAVELKEYNSLTDAMNKLGELERSEENGSAPANVKELIVNCNNEIQEHTSSLNNAMHNDAEHPLNLGSPAQVAELFYDKMGCPIVSADGKKTVNKTAQKALLKEKNDDGTLKFPVVQLYADYKKQVTLLQKFFGVLQDYMYPGGFIFSSFGQISTATGRMSCIEEHTKIMTVGGEKEIKDIKVGDMVYCYDNCGHIKIRKVLNVIDNGIKDCIKLDWKSTGNGAEGQLICTPDHKILSKDNGWVRADSLQYGDRTYHIHRSNEDRPRLFGANGENEQEQLLIKREVFKSDDYNTVIHHIDGNTRNNDITNLTLKSCSEHSREHTNKLVAEGKIKYEHLKDYKPPIMIGKEHPNYKDLSKDELIDMLIMSNGVVSALPIDYTTFVKKCKELGLNYHDLSDKIKFKKKVTDEDIIKAYNKTSGTVYSVAKELGIGRVQAENRLVELGLIKQKECHTTIELSNDEFIEKFNEAKGSIRKTAELCNITFWKAKKKIIELDLSYNHMIIESSKCGKHHVYDLEVEDYHNFIANEICVHNCSKPNAQQYPKAITKIVIPREGCVMVDADYSQIEYRVLTALAGNTELAKLFSNPDSDYHTLMASLMYGVDYSSVTGSMRSAAKSFNFGIPYGMGMGSLAILLTGKNTQQTRDEAAEKYEMYFKNQPRTRKFFADIKEMAQVNGYTKTLFNRYRYYSFTEPDGTINNAKKAAALRQAGNAVIQGCLDGDTLIQTKEFGIKKIKNLAGYSGEVWNGKEWTHGDILYSGKKQKCIITFSNGQKFICSPIHKFLVRSAKGNERFVECKDLATKQNSKNPHRIVINTEYTESDSKYSSDWTHKFDKTANNSNNAHLDNIYSSFDAGVLLGRLASDGTIAKRENGASYILNYIAEHEKSIIPEITRIMEFLGDVSEKEYDRPDRNETITRLSVYSEALVNEIEGLDIKHQISDKIFADTEMLRGFIRGLFDGDGGVSGKTITLTFGKQYDFTGMCKQIQKALLFFGIRSRIYEFEDSYKVTIKTNDNEKFMNTIGFINEAKIEKAEELECIKDEHIFGAVLIPESVEITDEYIDMYDVCNTDCGYYVADGIITHNTAADIFKISVARNFSYIRRNKLFGKFFIVNMIHDEQLMEVDVQHLNLIRIIADIGHNMQFKLDGFPPLYIGAGVGKAWGYAKGKQAEIHPLLLAQYQKEAEGVPIFREDCSTPVDTHKVLDYFADRVVEFRRQKVINYLIDSANWGNNIHPAIAGLINLQFNYGRGDDAKSYVGPNGEKYSDHEFLFLNLQDFITENKLDVKTEYFTAEQTSNSDEEEDKEYNDGEETGDDLDLSEFEEDMKFRLIDESDKVYGSNINDIIAQFGICVINHAHICGIDVRNIYFKNLDNIINYLIKHQCDESDPEALQVVYLKPGNILQKLPIFVKNINSESLENIYAQNE